MHIKRKKQAFMTPYEEKLTSLQNSWSFSRSHSSPSFEKKFRSCKYPSSTLGHTIDDRLWSLTTVRRPRAMRYSLESMVTPMSGDFGKYSMSLSHSKIPLDVQKTV